MLAPFIGQLVVCLADKTYITANCMHVLPLLGFIAPVKSGVNSVLIIVHSTIILIEQSHKMCEFSIGVPGTGCTHMFTAVVFAITLFTLNVWMVIRKSL